MGFLMFIDSPLLIRGLSGTMRPNSPPYTIMSTNSHTEVSQTGLGSNLGNSFGKMIAGIILVLLGIGGLFWNEGNYVKTQKALNEAQGQLVAVTDTTTYQSANEGKVVFMSGTAMTEDGVDDTTFDFGIMALAMKRKVQYYQWEESSETKEEQKLGGGTETTTTYNYKKVWTDEPIDSTSFKKSGYKNTVALGHVKEASFYAKDASLGAYTLSAAQLAMISGGDNLSLDDIDISVTEDVNAEVRDDVLYIHASANSSQEAQVGDMKVTWTFIGEEMPVSFIAKQQGKTFVPYVASSGRDVFLLANGVQSPESLFGDAHSDNSIVLWVVRIVGFLCIAIGLSCLSAPLEALANVVPFLGSIVGVASAIIAFVIAIPITLVVIAIAWLFYRPVIAIILLLLAGGVIYLFIKKRKKA